MYLTYHEYMNYGGTELEEPQFEEQYYKAAGIVDRYTFGRFRNDTKFPEELKRLVFRLIKTNIVSDSLIGMNAIEGTIGGNGTVSSESNDGVSVSYNNMSAKELYELIGNIKGDGVANYVQMYLTGVRNQKGQLVLFRGLYEDE